MTCCEDSKFDCMQGRLCPLRQTSMTHCQLIVKKWCTLKALLKGRQMNITVYTKSNCPNCVTAKQLLKSKNLDFTEISLDEEGRKANFMAAYPNSRQMPQIFIGDQHVGGLAGLQAALTQLNV